ncbi:hypothetical protein AU198_07945 [Mycobacterium sp. GA-1199]|nr:hypothetical protein AU198_07945 [Mycobacterium sp. GA-1199]
MALSADAAIAAQLACLGLAAAVPVVRPATAGVARAADSNAAAIARLSTVAMMFSPSLVVRGPFPRNCDGITVSRAASVFVDEM